MSSVSPSPGRESAGAPAKGPGRLARVLEIVLKVYACAIFVLLWVYVALAALTESSLPADTWVWLSGLSTVAAVIVWLAILPVAVFLWASQADFEPLVMGLVMLGLVAWTVVAWAGLFRLRRRRSGEDPV